MVMAAGSLLKVHLWDTWRQLGSKELHNIYKYVYVKINKHIFFSKAQAMIAERRIRLRKLLSSGESETIEIYIHVQIYVDIIYLYL